MLVVEDNDDDFYLLSRAFKKVVPHIELTRFENGADAIAYLSTTKRQREPLHGIMLLDLKLPGTSGFEVLQWIRSDAVFNRLVVNVLSSSNEDADIGRAYALGANAYAVKPMGIQRFESFLTGICHFWLEICELPRHLPVKAAAPEPQAR